MKLIGEQKDYSAESIQTWLVTNLAEQLNVSPESIDIHEPFYGYVIGGFQSWGIVTELEEWLGISLPSSVFYQHPDLTTLAQYLANEKRKNQTDNFSSSVIAKTLELSPKFLNFFGRNQ